MGALNLKGWHHKYRSWEIISIDSNDFLDSICTPIQYHVKDNQIIRIVPGFSLKQKDAWITDRTRFFFDGLSRQRLTIPLWRKYFSEQKDIMNQSLTIVSQVPAPQHLTVSWDFSFALMARHHSMTSTAVVGKNVDYTSIVAMSTMYNFLSYAADKKPRRKRGVPRIMRQEYYDHHTFSYDPNKWVPPEVFGPEIGPDGQPVTWRTVERPRADNPSIERRIANKLGINIGPEDRSMIFRANLFVLVNMRPQMYPDLQFILKKFQERINRTVIYTFGVYHNPLALDMKFEFIGNNSVLKQWIHGKLHVGELQMDDFENVIFLNCHDEDTMNVETDSLIDNLLEAGWGHKHGNLYVYNFPTTWAIIDCAYLGFKNMFYPHWAPLEELSGENFIGELTEEAILGHVLKGASWCATHYQRFPIPSAGSVATLTQSNLSPFTILHGSHGSRLGLGVDLTIPATNIVERGAFGTNVLGYATKFAFCYPGPLQALSVAEVMLGYLMLPINKRLNCQHLSFARIYGYPSTSKLPFPIPVECATYTYDTIV